MNSLTRVIFFRIFRTTVYSTVALAFCTWIVQSSKYMELLNNNLSLARFFRLTSFLSIDIIAFLLPITLAVSAGFVYHRLAESNQMVVLQASGIAPQRLLTPLMELALLVCGYLYVSNAYISPTSWREFRRIEFNIKNNIEPPENAGRIFSGSNFSVYAQKYYGECVFGNIFIIDSREKEKTYTLFAAKGTISNNILTLSNGERLEVNFSGHKNSVTQFQSYIYNLKEILNIQEAQTRPNEKFLTELLKECPGDPSKTEEQKALFHQKILSPILAVIFSLMAFFLVGLAPYVRKITYSRIAFLIMFIIVVQGSFLALANIAAKKEFFNYINYVFVFVMLLISILAVREKHWQKERGTNSEKEV
ncbi:MAG: LptF/LptG family permease [Alphaproteobacteria bacterium]|nr:LptF/LptG family permease [Alphaproteobacteria bacterium]